MPDFVEPSWNDAANLGNWEIQQQRKVGHYEERCVRTIFKHFGFDRFFPKMQQDLFELTGHRNVTLQGFNSQFPDFPLLLGSKMIQYLHRDAPMPSTWFKKFTKAPFYTAWKELHQSMQLEGLGDAPVGLVFPWHPFTDFAVLHDSPRSLSTGCFWLYNLGKEPKRTLILEPLTQLLAEFNWEPSDFC